MLISYRNDLKPIADLAQSFAARELAGKTEEHDRYPFGEFYDHVLDKAHEVGFLGAILPESLGGIGGDIGTLCVILQNICQVDGSIGGIIFTNAMAQEIMLAAGVMDLAQEIFPRAASPREFLVAFPSYTDPAQTDTLPTAVGSGKDFTLTGQLNSWSWAISQDRPLFRHAPEKDLLMLSSWWISLQPAWKRAIPSSASVSTPALPLTLPFRG